MPKWSRIASGFQSGCNSRTMKYSRMYRAVLTLEFPGFAQALLFPPRRNPSEPNTTFPILPPAPFSSLTPSLSNATPDSALAGSPCFLCRDAASLPNKLCDLDVDRVWSPDDSGVGQETDGEEGTDEPTLVEHWWKSTREQSSMTTVSTSQAQIR